MSVHIMIRVLSPAYVSFRQMRTFVPPFPPVGSVTASFESPAVPHLQPVLWGHKTARPSFRAPFGRPSGTAYLRTNTPAQRRRGARLGSWAIPLEACSGLGTP